MENYLAVCEELGLANRVLIFNSNGAKDVSHSSKKIIQDSYVIVLHGD